MTHHHITPSRLPTSAVAIRVLALNGSLRRGSHNRSLLQAAAQLMPPEVHLEQFSGLKAVPPYDADDDVDPPPRQVAALREAITVADAVLIATPEYNGSIPGHLKTAVDWASRPFPHSCLRDKPVAVTGASISPYGAASAQDEVRKVLQRAGARVIGEQLPVGAAQQAFEPDGSLRDSGLRRSLSDLVHELVSQAPRSPDLAA